MKKSADRKQNIEHPTSNIQHPATNIEHRTSNIQQPTTTTTRSRQTDPRQVCLLSHVHDCDAARNTHRHPPRPPDSPPRGGYFGPRFPRPGPRREPPPAPRDATPPLEPGAHL